jgi:hypothetical protein
MCLPNTVAPRGRRGSEWPRYTLTAAWRTTLAGPLVPALLSVIVTALRPQEEQPHHDCGAGAKQPPEGAAHLP